MEFWVPILIFIVGFVALFLELFVPALGIIGAIGIACMILGTVFAYRGYGNTVGTVFLVITLIGVPAMIMVGLKVFPRTFVGKKLILGSSMSQEQGYTSHTEEKYRELSGKEGVALTTLRPSGIVQIEGKKYSVVTSGELIEAKEKIKVVKVEGNRIVVRKC